MSALRLYVFLGAFLLFAMEPMVGRMLLPSFGGAFHVWATSLMFFQGALFLGYLYAHLLAKRAARRHLLLLAAPAFLLPPTARLATHGGDVGTLLSTLAVDFGLPFVALATTSVVAQGWLVRSTLPERTRPYTLYAVSNAGSLLALISYALVIEPLVGLSTQRWAWTIGYAAYFAAALVAYRVTHAPAAPASAGIASEGQASAGASCAGAPSADGAAREGAARESPRQEDEGPIRWTRILHWLLLSACPSVLLVAVTNLIALEAGNVPLVWVVPLALYLATFILAFAEPSRVPAWVRRVWPHFGAVGLFFFAGADMGGTWLQAILHLAVLFAICLAAHAQLYDARPSPRHLTTYYLVISLGGCLGGAFVALGAPVLFRGLYEYPIAIVGLAVTAAVAHGHRLLAWLRGPGRGAVAVTLLLLAAIGWRIASGASGHHPTEVRTLEVQRSFYGIYHVIARPGPHGGERDLVSGTTRHGRQFQADPWRREPLSYYHRSGPLGDAMEVLRERGTPRRVGVVGLGVGAAAAYIEPGETIEFFEIDETVVELARRHFTYLADCRGIARTIVGDARLQIAAMAERNDAPRYDLLLVDAFAGDAIPTHLVTLEAVRLYRRVLADRGVLLFHVSNRYYDLRPVLATIARKLGMTAGMRELLDPADREAADPSQYFVMLEREQDFAPFEARGFRRVTADAPPPTVLWTDDHVNTLAAILPDWE